MSMNLVALDSNKIVNDDGENDVLDLCEHVIVTEHFAWMLTSTSSNCVILCAIVCANKHSMHTAAVREFFWNNDCGHVMRK